MNDRLEALADAIADLNGWSDPASHAYQLRNPLLLRAYSLSRVQAQCEEHGHRIFSSALGGYRAGLNDLYLKLSGDSRAGLPPDAPLRQLLAVYGWGNPVAARRAVHFLQRALLDRDPRHEPGLEANTPIEWFLQTSVNPEVLANLPKVRPVHAGS